MTPPTEEDTELQAEIRQAIAEIESGDDITPTREQLERAALYGESPWPDESNDWAER